MFTYVHMFIRICTYYIYVANFESGHYLLLVFTYVALNKNHIVRIFIRNLENNKFTTTPDDFLISKLVTL